ncbi:putative bifunctional diguanylate cyclase/phosphodiesterase [Pseudoxanthomonas suwonensis]|uniref:putative bifunctional diguanylate cyclase/phosphodiesterase n=1 Tax=Pseudoxanthomonas suwonensis TaxID=314722 RepID=UPI000698E381|nr:EAL domain-containing protein [Pseudoxanthomonas suwonensis]
MIPAGTVESAPQALVVAGPRTPLERAVAVLHGLLPPGAQLAVGWRDPVLGNHFLMEPAMQAGPARRLELALAEAGSLSAEPGTLALSWHDAEDANLSLVARLPEALEATTREGWLATARTLLGSALEATRAQARMEKLEKSRRLQQALYEIAELASAEVEMGEMLHRLHAIIGSLMYAPNCYIVTYDDQRESVRFIYFADEADAYQPEPENEWTEEDMPNSLTFALLRHGRALRGPSNLIRRKLQVDYSELQGPDSQDWLGVPMKRGERVCGAIVVQSYDRPASYTDEDRALLGYVAQHVLTTLDRRQAQVELERRVRERTLELQHANRELQEEVVERQRAERLQHALFRITEMAMSSESLEQYHAKVHAAVDELIYARNFYIALLSDDQQSIEFVYSVDEKGDHRPTRRLSNGLTEYVLRMREALLADRADIDRLSREGEIHEFGIQAYSWLGVPLHRDGEVVGVLAVQSYTPQIRFSTDDQRLLTFVAHNISNGLARQRAQERLRAAHAELERRVVERTTELEAANEQLVAQIGERMRAEERLTHQALHDTLTGLPNRAYLLDCMASAIERAQLGDGMPFAVLFLDLDRFKLVNDSIGHAAGDELLVEVAKRIVSAMRAEDVVARLGGDEFAILISCPDGGDSVRDLAPRLLALIGRPVWVAGRELFPSASMGIALWHPRYSSGEELLRDADAAMYRAKNEGRDRYAIFDEAMREQAVRSLDLEADLRRAIISRDFLPYYQPILRLEDGQVVGHEALLRWQHERHGLLSPAAFIALGEESGLIEQVDWLLYEQVIGELARGGSGYVSVNVSPRHFRSPDFADRLLGLVQSADADPARLRVEITEVALLDDAPRTLRILNTLREHGVLAQLDDFGTGFSALSYLHRFPISGLKIDRSFVAGLDEEGGRQESLALVRAILALAGTLGIETVGEGVETEAQRDVLRELGCTCGQGFLLGRPAARRLV